MRVYARTSVGPEVLERMALGASRADVLRLVVSRGMLLANIGAGIGMALSLVAA